jgi:hypothetical protein
MQVNTRDGIFADQGYGGGVFNQRVGMSGLGRTNEALPSGVGATALGGGNIPWQCWDEPGFKDCHAECWNEEAANCRNNVDIGPGGIYETMDECIADMTTTCAVERCVSQYCSQSYVPSRGGASWWVGLPCNNYRVIQHVQSIIGAEADGAWGPLSQAAYEQHRLDGGASYAELANGCTGPIPAREPEEPEPVRPAPVVPVPEPEPIPVVTPRKSSKAWMWIGGLGLAAAAAGVYAMQKKKKP